MKYANKLILVAGSLSLVSVLSACGGGGSDSGAGSEGTTPIAAAPYMGTYRGPFSMTGSAPGVAPVTSKGATTIVVNTDNSVVVDPGPGEFYGRYNPDTQKMMASFQGSDVDPACNGKVTLMGTHIFDRNAGTHSIDGKVSSNNFTCLGAGMKITGKFETNQMNSNTFSRSGRGIVDALRESSL